MSQVLSGTPKVTGMALISCVTYLLPDLSVSKCTLRVHLQFTESALYEYTYGALLPRLSAVLDGGNSGLTLSVSTYNTLQYTGYVCPDSLLLEKVPNLKVLL